MGIGIARDAVAEVTSSRFDTAEGSAGRAGPGGVVGAVAMTGTRLHVFLYTDPPL